MKRRSFLQLLGLAPAAAALPVAAKEEWLEVEPARAPEPLNIDDLDDCATTLAGWHRYNTFCTASVPMWDGETSPRKVFVGED